MAKVINPVIVVVGSGVSLDDVEAYVTDLSTTDNVIVYEGELDTVNRIVKAVTRPGGDG